ncbi:branched-chain amino acid transaminase [Desulfobaculum sp. SPO524]|uniref:branched-chain amino acid transaminase n=1 Tax=Desulfobaculum sp. SPO524 TaxID=3378071 RepID=UPI003852ED08
MVQQVESIWFDGKLVPWNEAQVHVLTHTLHYGCGVFEGIRAYKLADGGSAVFRLKEHVHRHFNSAKILEMQIPFTEDEICDAILETLQANKMDEGYIRPLSFIGAGAMGVFPGDNPIQTIIATWPWGAYLGEEALDKGIRVKTSSFTRHHVNVMMTKAKTSGNYVNSVLAKREALADGYDEALMLDTEGYVSEATGENIFIVRGDIIKTTPLTSVLDGLTRNSIITVAKDLGYEIVEQRFTRDELYSADEAFFCGTAAEVTPIREVDRRQIGAGTGGRITKHLQTEYFKVVKGENPNYAHWLDRYTV